MTRLQPAAILPYITQPKTKGAHRAVRIVTGDLRGRRIPSGRLGNLRLTSSRLKEAIFSMLGADLQGFNFLDLCAGSGQMGLEALSRGSHVVFNEPDRKRYHHLRGLLREWRVGAEMHEVRAEMLIPRLGEEARRFDTIYIDPPYHARHSGAPLCMSLLERLGEIPLLNPEGLIIAQHQKELELPPDTGTLKLLRSRDYGNTSLSIYGIA
ncbi:MAG: 16S rRNA (guanine(966)-N(2))-methyltransferase RsmD [Candidatus Latescibacterota bacterium]